MTAPESRLRAVLDAAWEAINEAVSAGLEQESVTLLGLSKLLVVDSTALAAADATHTLSEGDPLCRPELEKLANPQLEEVTATTQVRAWAQNFWYRHHCHVLETLIKKAPEGPEYTAPELEKAVLHGQGGLRLVHLKGENEVAKQLHEKGRLVEVLDVSAAWNDLDVSLPGKRHALLMREIGGPYLQRPKDPALGWDAIGLQEIRLVLETSWRLLRVEEVEGKAPVVRLTLT